MMPQIWVLMASRKTKKTTHEGKHCKCQWRPKATEAVHSRSTNMIMESLVRRRGVKPKQQFRMMRPVTVQQILDCKCWEHVHDQSKGCGNTEKVQHHIGRNQSNSDLLLEIQLLDDVPPNGQACRQKQGQRFRQVQRPRSHLHRVQKPDFPCEIRGPVVTRSWPAEPTAETNGWFTKVKGLIPTKRLYILPSRQASLASCP